MRPRKDSAVCHHLLNWNYSPIFEDFSVLCHENKKYLLELKESLLIMKDRNHQWIESYIPPLSICLNKFLSHYLLRSVDFWDQFFIYFTLNSYFLYTKLDLSHIIPWLFILSAWVYFSNHLIAASPSPHMPHLITITATWTLKFGIFIYKDLSSKFQKSLSR